VQSKSLWLVLALCLGGPGLVYAEDSSPELGDPITFQFDQADG